MSDAKPDSSRNLLAEIEGDWETAKPSPVVAKPAKAPLPSEQELHAELDAAADRLVESLDPPPVSARNLDDLDSGWGDDGEDEEESDDEEEDDEANEPALPDERLDPVAYAAAKKARDERIEARREKRRLKLEAKKARRRARADAQKSKQKGKQRKARPQKPAAPERKAKSKPVARVRDAESDSVDIAEEIAPSRASAKAAPRVSSAITKPMLSKTNQWMLAVAVIVFVAAAIFAAVVAR